MDEPPNRASASTITACIVSKSVSKLMASTRTRTLFKYLMRRDGWPDSPLGNLPWEASTSSPNSDGNDCHAFWWKRKIFSREQCTGKNRASCHLSIELHLSITLSIGDLNSIPVFTMKFNERGKATLSTAYLGPSSPFASARPFLYAQIYTAQKWVYYGSRV